MVWKLFITMRPSACRTSDADAAAYARVCGRCVPAEVLFMIRRFLVSCSQRCLLSTPARAPLRRTYSLSLDRSTCRSTRRSIVLRGADYC